MISVVIPLYNKAQAITATIQSVFAQTYTDWELVIVNDGSTDNSLAVAQQVIAGDERCRIIDKPNGGVCSARNRGIQEVKCDYIAFLDGDDLWEPAYLEEQTKLMEEFPDAAMWGINFAETQNGQIVRRVPTALPDGFRGYVENYFQMSGRVSDLFHSSAVVVRKSVFNQVGDFDTRIKYAEDNDMWFRIIARYPVVFYDKYLVHYQWDAENRALNKEIQLKYYLPYYPDKYAAFKDNAVFYKYINHWCAIKIAQYYFTKPKEREDAKTAATRLDYGVIPVKYRWLFQTPFGIGWCVWQMAKLKKAIFNKS